jgi:hypothetical protein
MLVGTYVLDVGLSRTGFGVGITVGRFGLFSLYTLLLLGAGGALPRSTRCQRWYM